MKQASTIGLVGTVLWLIKFIMDNIYIYSLLFEPFFWEGSGIWLLFELILQIVASIALFLFIYNFKKRLA